MPESIILYGKTLRLVDEIRNFTVANLPKIVCTNRSAAQV